MNTPLTDNDLAALRQEMNDLRAEMASLRSNGQGNHNGIDALTDPAITDRRGMMKTMAGLAVGVATVGLLRPSTSRAGTDEVSADGGNLIIGATNSGTNTTTLRQATLTLAPVQLEVQNYGSTLLAVPTEKTGVFGAANTAGTSNVNSAVCGIFGRATTTGTGLATGVIGFGTDSGVTGFSQDTGGLGGQFTGIRAALRLVTGSGSVANPNVTPPAGGTFGDLYRSSTRSGLWYHVGAGVGGPYRRLADSGTAGQLTILPTPIRFIDTRNGTGGAGGAYQNGTVRQYNFVSLQSGTIPSFARGIVGNLTAASPTGNGNFQTNTVNSFPAGSAAVMSFRTGVNLSNHFLSALDENGTMFVRANFASVHLVIDIQGYYI